MSATATTTPHHQNPLFPFGYGLSYTTFSYSGLRLHPGPRGSEIATVTITGRTAGAEVAQLYLTDPASAGEPPYQLKGFQKVTLPPERSQQVTLRDQPPGHELLQHRH